MQLTANQYIGQAADKLAREWDELELASHTAETHERELQIEFAMQELAKAILALDNLAREMQLEKG